MDKNYFMVRAMGSSENDFKVFFENNVVAVGWSEIHFNEFDTNSEELIEKVKISFEAVLLFVRKRVKQVPRF